MPASSPPPPRSRSSEAEEPVLAPQHPPGRPRPRPPAARSRRRRRSSSLRPKTTSDGPPRHAAAQLPALRLDLRAPPAAAGTPPAPRRGRPSAPASAGHVLALAGAPPTAASAGLRRRLLLGRGALLLLGAAGLALPEARLQRVHQVDDVAALRLGGDDRLVALQLLLDHRHQRRLVAVLVGLGIELGGLLLDQRLGELEHLRVRLRVRDVVEVGRGRPHLVRRRSVETNIPLSRGADRHHPLAARQHQPGDRQLVGLAHRLAQHDEGLLGHRAVRRQVVGRVLVDHVDLVGVDEGLDVQGVVGLELHRLEVLVLDDDVLLVLVLVALHQVRALDQPELGIDRLHVDPVVGVLVQLVEADPLVRAGRRVEPHRAAHQAQLQITLPARSRRHCGLLRGGLRRGPLPAPANPWRSRPSRPRDRPEVATRPGSEE